MGLWVVFGEVICRGREEGRRRRKSWCRLCGGFSGVWVSWWVRSGLVVCCVSEVRVGLALFATTGDGGGYEEQWLLMVRGELEVAKASEL